METQRHQWEYLIGSNSKEKDNRNREISTENDGGQVFMDNPEHSPAAHNPGN